MKEKLSIIIPAYNAEKSIERCLDSILDQDYHNEIEIIVVNDGSTDSTGSILNKYQKQIPSMFRIITKENGGLPSARNAGLDAAVGDWIWFCDADDYICKNGLSYVLNSFVDDDIDICTFNSITLDSLALKTFKEPEDVSGKCFFEGSTISLYKMKFPVFVWNHLYRLEALKNLRFRNVVMCEDTLFNLEVYMKNLPIRCTDANIYRYTISKDQLTRKRDSGTMKKAITGFELLFDTAKKYQMIYDDEDLSKSFDRMIALMFPAYMSRALSINMTIQEFRDLINRLKRKGLFPILEVEKLSKACNLIGSMPYLYPIESFLYQKVFLPYFLPKLSRN